MVYFMVTWISQSILLRFISAQVNGVKFSMLSLRLIEQLSILECNFSGKTGHLELGYTIRMIAWLTHLKHNF